MTEQLTPELKASFEAIVRRYETGKIGFREALEEAYNLDKWVDVNERLPEIEGQRVLCITTSGLRAIGYILHGVLEMDGRSKSFYEMGYEVTHWQNLPNKPI